VSLLEVRDLSLSFAGLKALREVSFDVEEGEVLGLIGPNGAGKTTMLNCISRLYDPNGGSITFDGKDMLRVPMHGIAPIGIARTFQNLEVHPGATVLENVTMACAWRYRSSLVAEMLALPSARARQDAARNDARKTLEQLDLQVHADATMGSLSFGTQKTIELARAMASSPKLLLLDEPAAGLNPDETTALGQRILSLRRDHGVTVVLIEHDMSLVMGTCDRIVVLDHGVRICSGTPAHVRADPAVMAAYLGDGDDDA
jgi:ABC-type branched-subunit amino acid transport system ATPase component